ncbi:SLC13 family permease [Neomoorella humiferrea]
MLDLLAGPLSGLVVFLLTTGAGFLDYKGRIALATFAWVVMWWITQPLPWGITSLLPMAIFPLTGIKDVNASVAMYGQNVLFWIVGVVVAGYAIEKSGLTARIASRLVRSPFFKAYPGRLLFGYMLTTDLISMFISDAATVAMMLPVGISIAEHLDQKGTLAGGAGLRSTFALATLYAAVAGGIATLAGVPHNAVIASFLVRQGVEVSFLDWSIIGMPFSLIILLVFYLIVYLYLLPPGYKDQKLNTTIAMSNGERVVPLSKEEKNVLLIFGIMIFLWLLPGISNIIWGYESTIAVKLNMIFPIWIVPIIGLLLFFMLPVDLERRKFILEWQDFVNHGGWNVALLATGGCVLGNSLQEFGVISSLVKSLPLTSISLFILIPVIYLVLLLLTNFISGTAAVTLICSVALPVVSHYGYNPLLFGVSLSSLGLGIWLPWAGAAAGTAFASGNITIKQMVSAGGIASVALLATVIILNILYILF